MPIKRTREVDWVVRLDDSSALRTVVETVFNVVTRVTVKISRTNKDSPYYMRIDTADMAYVSCISVRYKLEDVVVHQSDEEIRFCIDFKHLKDCLSNVRQDHSLRIEGDSSDACPKILIHTYFMDNSSHETSTELPTFVDTDAVSLFQMNFDKIMQIDLVEFRSIVKHAITTKAEQIGIRVYTREEASTIMSLTLFSVQGEFNHDHSFCHEVTRDEDGSMIVRAASDGPCKKFDIDTIEPSYEGLFPVDKIMGFLKPLQCRMLSARIQQGQPIMFEHAIGGSTDSDSYIRFLLAPIIGDS